MIDIDYISLLFLMPLIALILLVNYILKLKMEKRIIVSMIRMFVQLSLVALILNFLLTTDNLVFTLLWFAIMISFAVHSVLDTNKLDHKYFLVPLSLSVSLITFAVLIYLNVIILKIKNPFSAKFFIIMGGMLLGNSLRGNIIGIKKFYDGIIEDYNAYLFSLSQGANQIEAVLPYVKKSLKIALNPALAVMATIGIVSLPGMMTGQILADSSVFTAIKYQITIMIAIFTCTMMGVLATIFLSQKFTFDKYGLIKIKK